MQGQSLDQGDPLEEGTVTHSSILAWIEEPGYDPRGHKELGMTEGT